MTIQVQAEKKKRILKSIKRYFAEELDQEIGDLKASLLLEFCLKEIGPTIYNDAISDAQAYFQDRVADLEGTCHEPEFGHWKR
jgi:uncharacterized protein (DUF2164 family)